MIWVIGGTKNANEICKMLIDRGEAFLVSVTTDYGLQLAQSSGSRVIKEAMDARQMTELVAREGVSLIVDASHPFATDVSTTAMGVATASNVAYLRFERPSPIFEGTRYFETYHDVVRYLAQSSGNVFITTGSKHCNVYASLDVKRLFIRVLATPSSLAQCHEAGFLPGQVFTMTEVVSTQDNEVFMKQHDIRYLVTKESGNEGGLNEKIDAARCLGVEVLVISRPAIAYPQCYSDYHSLMLAVANHLNTRP